MPIPEGASGDEQVAWLLVSPNNRPLGRGGERFASFAACREAVLRLRQLHSQLRTAASTEAGGRWAWRADLDGTTVAVSSRTYQRQRECAYNLRRFLEALPSADLVSAIRDLRGATR